MLFKCQIQLLAKGAAVLRCLTMAAAVSWQGTAAGNLPAPRCRGSERRCHMSGLRGASQGGLLLLLGAVKCDAAGAFPARFIPGLRIWEGGGKNQTSAEDDG